VVTASTRRGLIFASIAASLVLALLWATKGMAPVHAQSTEAAIFLCILGAVLSIPSVRLEHGHLSLSAIACVAAAMLLTPPQAAFVGLGMGFATKSRDLTLRSTHVIAVTLYVALAAAISRLTPATILSGAGSASTAAIAYIALNLGITGLLLNALTAEPVLAIWRRTATRTFIAAFAYFGLAGVLVASVLDGSPRGYFLTVVIAILAIALTDTIGGRRIRTVLEAEVSVAERHTMFSRAAEGVVHNIRNNLAVVQGYLQELRHSELKPDDQETVAMALTATNDVLNVLRSLSAGATPQARFEATPVDLNEVAVYCAHSARQRARIKRVEVALRESPERVSVRADQALLREVVINLLNNAIDAVPVGGHVRIEVGTRQQDWPYLSVLDDGPGVSEENRQRLFEPHFTTKHDGTGLGLFVSYGIVREHQGELLYEGGHRGAIFTVLLPPFDAEPRPPGSQPPPASADRRTHPAPQPEPARRHPPPR